MHWKYIMAGGLAAVAAGLAVWGVQGWGWFLFVAALMVV